jgi:Leucine rich repeat
MDLVQSFTVRNHRLMTKVPGFLFKFFPNLEVISILHTGLNIVEKDDFYGLSKIRVLSLPENRIETIGNDAFIHVSQTLEVLCLRDNPIVTIGFNALNPRMLKEMTQIQVNNWTCIKETNYSVNRDQTLKIINKIVKACPPTFEMEQLALFGIKNLVSEMMYWMMMILDEKGCDLRHLEAEKTFNMSQKIFKLLESIFVDYTQTNR